MVWNYRVIEHKRVVLDYVLPVYLKAINANTSSVTVKHLSLKTIAEMPLPLPTMDQQKLIVAEIKKQFSRLDEAVAGLKRYKASVLKAAVEGKLTEEWRSRRGAIHCAPKKGRGDNQGVMKWNACSLSPKKSKQALTRISSALSACGRRF